MGMSASQARLLSITSRLSDNELRSQTITTAKMSLANRTTAASAAYMDAMADTELRFSSYDSNGTKVTQKLTGASLSEYAPLKNQYGIINNSGQILVSERDAVNYKNSANIVEFLEKYGFANSFTQTETITTIDHVGFGKAQEDYEETLKDFEDWEAKKPEKTNPVYIIPGTESLEYNYYDDFVWATAVCYIAAMSWFSNELDLGDLEIRDTEGHLVAKFIQKKNENEPDRFYVADCDINFEEKNGEMIPYRENFDDNNLILLGYRPFGGCYSHVFSHLLLLDQPYTTTTGESVTIRKHINGEPSDLNQHWWGDTNGENYRYYFAQRLAKLIHENVPPLMACGDTGADITQNSSQADKLMSDYYIDKDGNKQLKTLEQKIVDLDYEYTSNILSTQEAYDGIMHFVDHDLKKVLMTEEKIDEEQYEQDLADWEAARPELGKEPTIEDFTTTTTNTIVTVEQESEEGQWYINLWHRMNGASIYKTTINGVDNGIHDPEDDGVIKGDNVKSPTNGLTANGQKLWAVLEDGLMNNPDWLKYALENCKVSLERVNFTDPTEYGTGLKYYSWTSIIHSNAVDITEERDEKAAIEAEAKYEQELRDIEAKDKQYDNQLKVLDTEHSALQTEYDSVKGIIGKNIERTLKIYS